MDKLTPPELPDKWNRCHAFMAQKNRYCRQMPAKGTIFCGNHVDYISMCCPATSVDGDRDKVNNDSSNQSPKKRSRIDSNCEIIAVENVLLSKKKERGRRIPCPIDPSHTIYESNLKAHSKKCNKLRQRKNEEGMLYYRNGFNLGGFGGFGCETIQDDTKTNVDTNYYQNLAVWILKTYAGTFLASSTFGLSSMSKKDHQSIEKVEESEHVSDTVESTKTKALHEVKDILDLTHESLYEKIKHQNLFEKEQTLGLEQSLKDHRIRIGGPKHMEQVGSIVGHVRQMIHAKNEEKGNEKSKNRVTKILEMGAGRATTGFVVASVVASINNGKSNGAMSENNDYGQKVKLIAVEKAGSRGKADRAIQREKRNESRNEGSKPNLAKSTKRMYMDVNNVDIQRIKCDLAHLHLQTVLSMNNDSNVENSTLDESNSNCRDILVIAKHCCGAGTDLALKSIVPIKKRIYGCIFTTCCHGVCSWESYVGRDYLNEAFAKSSHDLAVESSFGEREFDLMRRWACGTVIGEAGIRKVKEENIDVQNDVENEDDQPEHEFTVESSGGDDPKNITRVVKLLQLKCGSEGLGRACQRLIDFGRCQFMKDQLFGDDKAGKVSLCHYVDSSVTPQNALLSAQYE